MKKPPIISPKTCQELFKGIEITDTQRKARDTWLEKIENKELAAETTNYRKLEDIILRDLLDFPEELIQKFSRRRGSNYNTFLRIIRLVAIIKRKHPGTSAGRSYAIKHLLPIEEINRIS